MKDFIATIRHVCASHTEKMVLAVAAVVCAWLFFSRVLFSPSAVSIDGRTLSPGRIDRHLEQQAQELQGKLHQGKEGRAAGYVSRLNGRIEPNDPVIAGIIDRPLPNGFQGLLGDPLGFLGAGAAPQPPRLASTRPPEQPTPKAPRATGPAQVQAGPQSPPPVPVTRPEKPGYRLPQVPELTEVIAGHMRAAAYVPVAEVTPQTPYSRAEVELDDIDLVTVEARFDVGELYHQFWQSFGGRADPKQSRDPCLADPVFAAVHLQRQESLGDEKWSEWQDVPRSRVEARRELFQVIERVQDLPAGGMELRLAQFRPRQVTMALLQPEACRIASADEEWFPPSYHDIYWGLQRKADLEDLREQRQQQKQAATGAPRSDVNPERFYDRTRRTPRTGPAGRTRGTTRYRQGADRSPGAPPLRRDRTRTGRRAAPEDMIYADMDVMNQADKRRQPAVDDVYADFAEELIREDTDLSEWEEGLLIWAIDDTVEPDRMYRYRLRVGVFNPVAGTDRLAERDKDKNDQVILWSEYSDPTEPVWIPGRLYLFAKSVHAQTGTVTMEVSRYRLGYWRTESFQVRPGDPIGRTRELKEPQDRSRPPRGPYPPMPPGEMHAPVTVDFSTGKRLADLVEVPASAQHPQAHYEAVLSGDGTDAERMPIGASHWSDDLMGAYQYVQSEKRRTPKPLRPFSRAGPHARREYDLMDPAGLYPDQ